MVYTGEYCLSPTKYDKLKRQIIKNKTNTSSITFPNGIKNKVFLNFNLDKKDYEILLLDPINKNNIIIVKRNNSFYEQSDRLIMYENILESFESNGMLSATFYDVQRENELQRQIEENY